MSGRNAPVRAVLLAGALASFGCEAPTPPSLLLLSVDTLRPDRLGYAGGRPGVSPAIDRLAGEAAVFENAWSAAGWTLPAVATLLTGLHPRDHGATSYALGLRDGIPTLASILRARGYDTRAFVSHILLGPEYGLAAGFDVYDASVLDVGHPHRVSTARPLTDRVLADLARRPLEPPFFLWVHYFDPHHRYLLHPETASFGRTRLDRYDGEIAHTDRQIARLLESLHAAGLYAGAVVAFTSDHGEEFGEHDGRFHDTLYEEVLRVPLLIRAPGLAPGPVRAPAEQIDLLPTLLGLLGFEPPAGVAGRDLLGQAAEGPVFFERDLPLPFRQRGVRLGDHKLVAIDLVPVEIDESRREHSQDRPDIRPGVTLYDLARDPGETRDLYAEDDPEAQRLMALLLEHFDEGVGPENRVEVDAELERRLRALGYLR